MSQQIHAIALDVLKPPNNPGADTLVFAPAAPGTTLLAPPDGFANPLLVIDHPTSALAGKVAIAPFVTGATCDQIVLAFTGDKGLAVFSPCRVDEKGMNQFNREGSMQFVPPILVSLPAGDAIGPGVFAADVDADGHLDLVIDAATHMLVAYGDGKGGFFPKPGSMGAPLSAGPLALPKETTRAIALGDGGTGAARFLVTPRGIYLLPGPKSSPCPGNPGDAAASCPLELNLGAPWTEAVVADLNRDGLTDVIAASAESNDLGFFNGAPSGLLNPSTISTLGAVSHLTLGDFDGDLVNDVAFVQAGTEGSGQTVGDALEILYGRPSGPPEPPAFVGRFDRVQEVISARLPSFGSKIAVDLAVSSRSPDDTEQSVAVLTGNGDRVLLAPFGLQVIAPPMPNLKARPIATTLGQVAGDAKLDMIAIAFDAAQKPMDASMFTLWAAESKPRGRFGTPIVSELLPTPVHPLAPAGRQVVFLEAGDLAR